MFLRAGLVFLSLLSANAKPPRSLVHSAVAAESSATTLPELVKELDADGRVRAVSALDQLDRRALDAVALAELSEAYRLLGRTDEAVAAAQALSARDSTSSAGEVQSILSLAQSGNFASAEAAAVDGLKRFPGDKNLLALYHQVKGRGLGAASPNDGGNTRPTAAAEEHVSARAPIKFTPRQHAAGAVGISIPAPMETVTVSDTWVVRATSWTKRKVDESTSYVVQGIDRRLGLKSGEEEAASTGARTGGAIGAGVGAIGGVVVAAGVCAPAVPTGAPYGACVAAGGAGGVIFVTPPAAYLGGVLSVGARRARIFISENFGIHQDEGDPSKAE